MPLRLPRTLLRSFIHFEVFDPSEMGSNSRVSTRFPASNNVNTYTLRNRGVSTELAAGALSSFAMHAAGDLMFGHIQDRFATEIGIAEPGVPRYCITTMLKGSLFCRNTDTIADADGETGLIYRGSPGQRFLSSDANERFTIWLDAARLEHTLESLTDAPLRRPLTFLPVIDWRTPRAAALRRMVAHMARELTHDDGLLSASITREGVTDLLVHAILTGLPHSHTGLLARTGASPVPRHVRRAEAFMHEAADQPIRLADAAAAAGCSIRTLQAAFRRYRDTTPLAAIHEVRMQHVRLVLQGPGGETVGSVARRFGFTNSSRFVAAYQRRFRETPGETRAGRAGR